jgi:hypothetical protein
MVKEQYNTSEEAFEETVDNTSDTVDGVIVDDTLLNEAAFHNEEATDSISLENMISMNDRASTGLLADDVSENLRRNWSEIQGRFVDEPRSAVQEADKLVTEVIEKITQMFTDEHLSLENQWSGGDEVSTEDLRQALQHYRSFFNRLVV